MYLTLIIDNVDFSDYCQQKTDRTETMRKIVGNAQDYAVDGTLIADLVTVKWDPAFLLKPLPKPMMQDLIAAMEREQVTLQYTSVRTNELRTIEAIPLSMSVKYATTWQGIDIYADTPISFEEV